MKSGWSTCLLALLALSCVRSSSSDSHDDAKEKQQFKAYVLNQAPADVGSPLNIDFDGKVTLLGCRVAGGPRFTPGQPISITLYWRSNKQLEPGWSLFTHVIDASGERLLNVDNVGPLREWRGDRQALGPSSWEPGKVYVDEQRFTLAPATSADKIQIVTGVWRKNERLKALSGPHDSTNRGIAATLTSSGARPAVPHNTRVPSLRVDKLSDTDKIKIDGKLDEPAWAHAPSTGPLVNVQTGAPNSSFPVNGEAKLLWNDSGFYVGFEVSESDIVGGFKKGDKDPHLWTKDTVEIMVDPDGDGDNKDYYEIQISPQNLVFDSAFDDYNTPRNEPNGPFGHQDWSAELESAVKLDGTIDKSSDHDKGYTVEAFIPWKSFGKAKTTPPSLGTTWRINFYAMKNNSGVAWSPILGQGNFHKASRFGRVLWAEKGWAPTRAALATPKQLAAELGDRRQPTPLHAAPGALRAKAAAAEAKP